MSIQLNPTLARAALAAALLLAVAGSNRDAFAQSAPVPPVPPVPPTDAVVAVAEPPVHTWSMSSSNWTIMTNQDGRSFKIEGKGDDITAEIDGKAVPSNRIVRDGDTVKLKDENGEVVFEQMVPTAQANTHVFLTGPGGTTIAPRAKVGKGKIDITPYPRKLTVAGVEAPKVMIGVQLLDPDSSIRGHLGLKDDESTMVSAVYDGLPAAEAGLEPYDIITAVNDKSPAPPATVRKALRDTDAGKSLTFEVIHRGQKKTVTVTAEKYDHARLEKAKVRQITAAATSPEAPAAIASLGGDFDKQMEVWARAGGVGGAQPFVYTIPGQGGRAQMIWGNPGSANEMAKHLQELAAQAQEQAAQARVQAEQMREQAEHMRQQMQDRIRAGAVNVPGGLTPQSQDMNQLMDQRMKAMEEMLKKIMEKQNAKPDGKGEGRSLLPAARAERATLS